MFDWFHYKTIIGAFSHVAEMRVSFASLNFWNIRPKGEYGFWGSQRPFTKKGFEKGRGRDLNPG
jgi:hypothetical protein